MIHRRRFSPDLQQRAAALVIVLAFVVLVTGLVVAYMSRTQTDRTVAHASFNETKVDELAASAAEIIIGDLRQEIVDGSASPAPIVGTTALYAPTPAANIVPKRSGNPPPVAGVDPIPNLVRVSVRSDTITSPGVGSRASAVNSTTDVSSNGRSVSLARWNSHYLIPRSDWSEAKIDSTPLSPVASPMGPGDTTGFTPPDWVILTRSGPAEFSVWNGDLADRTADNYAIGRYAYAIYDEGGLVDVNVAGYPSPAPTPTPPSNYITDIGRKGILAFADLTALPTSTATPPETLSTGAVNRIVGWRNFATTQQPSSSPFPTGFSFNSAMTTLYNQSVLNRTDGFMKISAAVWTKPGSNPNPRTDQLFLSRQQLLDFRRSTDFSQNALQYMGTSSRETEPNAPQWSPTTPTAVNPNFQTMRVTGSFLRNDGTTATVGDYLVKKRFLLQRLNWLTYKGPSASRTMPTSAPSAGDANYDMWILIDPARSPGLTTAFLAQGTNANILKYFGLVWDGTNERWNYVGHSGGSALAGSLATLGTLTATREPDFFELLQSGIINASLGDASGNPPQAPTPTPSPTASPTPTVTPTATVPPTPAPNAALPIVHQQSKMLQLLTIGANLIAQARTDSYPVRIAFNNAGAEMEAMGMPRLPYLNALAACPIGATGTSGGIHWFLTPNLWDPFRNNWDLTQATTNTPLYPRPAVRIRVTGSAAFGSTFASPSPTPPVTGRSVDSTAVTTFSASTVAFTDLTLQLKSGTTVGNAFGRDGIREASRMSTSDITTSLTAFTTTTSPTALASLWTSVARPKRPDATQPGTTNFLVFRLSVPGAIIPSTALSPGQNPVLVLGPGFQMAMDYQSPNGAWYPYSFLQGNSASSTWISANLNLSTTFSQYGLNPTPPVGVSPTLLSSGAVTQWDMTTLADAPMFAKADPRSIRYNSQIGVVRLPIASPSPTPSAGIIDSIWPGVYPSIPLMSPDLNPAMYSQVNGDNAASVPSPYNEVVSGTITKGDLVRPIVMNRPFRSVGEMGYAFRDQPFKTLDFSSSTSPDAGLLDLFSVNEYTDSFGMRAGVVNLNGGQGGAVAAVLSRTIAAEGIASAPAPAPSPSVIPSASALSAGKSLAKLASSAPVVNRAGLTTLIAGETGLGATTPKTQREAIARALGEVVQTRTWNLLIDVIAQSGKYPSGANDLTKFVVEGEQRYWVHVAIDRLTNQVIDRQIEVVKE